MSEKMINVSRYRSGEYTVNYNMGGRFVTYKWAGSQDGKIDTKPIPEYVVDWLVMSTTAISGGSLVIEKDDSSKEIRESINYEEEVKNVVHTREEISKILTGNFNKMKSELNKIDNADEKSFVITVAQDLDIDSVAKREFLSEWIGISMEMLFANEE